MAAFNRRPFLLATGAGALTAAAPFGRADEVGSSALPGLNQLPTLRSTPSHWRDTSAVPPAPG
ncbi:hypothetical protein LMG18102_00407 [Ralstonia mannitolilytica]|nr:hypothetical protein LMG18102_00407 [Ralstonia mannitolilytica]